MEEVKKIVESVVDILPVAIAILSTIIVFVKTGNVKKSLKELENMNYRKASYRQVVEKDKDGNDIHSSDTQFIGEVENTYKLNKAKNLVEKTTDTVNLQEIIQSCAETALQKVLAKYLPQTEEDPVISSYQSIGEDLDFLTEQQTELEDIRQAYGLPVGASFADMEKALREKYDKLAKEIESRKRDNDNEKTPSNE